MAFCRNCGEQIDDLAVICPKCGVAQEKHPTDSGGFWWGVLGCALIYLLFYILGAAVDLILYLAWKDSYPKRAKSFGKGALLGALFPLAVSLTVWVISTFFALISSAFLFF